MDSGAGLEEGPFGPRFGWLDIFEITLDERVSIIPSAIQSAYILGGQLALLSMAGTDKSAILVKGGCIELVSALWKLEIDHFISPAPDPEARLAVSADELNYTRIERNFKFYFKGRK